MGHPLVPYRILGILAFVSFSCQDASLPAVETPTLVKAAAPTSIAQAPVQLSAGENWAWEVSWRGLKVGTATLGVHADEGALRVESHFRTAGVANDMRALNHRLETRVDASNHPRDDIHSAFGRLRSWVHPQAAPATITL